LAAQGSNVGPGRTSSIELSPIEAIARLWRTFTGLSGQVRRVEVVLSGDSNEGGRV
jgi:hypothetical protein